jgi:predicted acetyltransferase
MVAKGALLRLLAHLLTEMITRGPSTSYLTTFAI